jgi:hypothetical protein
MRKCAAFPRFIKIDIVSENSHCVHRKSVSESGVISVALEVVIVSIFKNANYFNTMHWAGRNDNKKRSGREELSLKINFTRCRIDMNFSC